MPVHPLPDIAVDVENRLVRDACNGDDQAFGELIEPWRRPLFGYVYRMVTHPEDAEDLTQEAVTRAFQSLPEFRAESRFKSWLFGIATHICLDHLRKKKRWRVEAQLEGEKRADREPETLEQLGGLMAQPDFVFEIREHIAFCFSCVARTLEPEEQAALMLREVLGFSAREAADILDVTDSVYRHRLSSARSQMCVAFTGLCQLINKTGVCYQCSGLRDHAPEENRAENLSEITVMPGLDLTPDNLLDARTRIAREADLEKGGTRRLHEGFFVGLAGHEESR